MRERTGHLGRKPPRCSGVPNYDIVGKDNLVKKGRNRVNPLERLQIITEIIGEFRTAILIDQEPEKVGRLVLEVIQEAGDTTLADLVLNAYMKLANRELAVSSLDEAIQHMHDKIDTLVQTGEIQEDTTLKH
jgi:hypothetical protein